MHLACPAPFLSRGLGYPDHISFFRPRRDSIKTRLNQIGDGVVLEQEAVEDDDVPVTLDDADDGDQVDVLA